MKQADTMVEDAGSGRYAYETLSKEEQLIYNQLVDGLNNYEKKITVSTNDENKLKKVYQAVICEHSEIFWVEGYQFTGYEVGGVQTDYVVQPIYIYSEEQIQERQKMIDNYVQQCQQGLPADADDYQKVKYVYEYLIHNTEYNVKAEESQNICSVFIQRESVCMGYALAMQYLLDRFQVTNIVVSGTADGESHAWNLVKMDGDFYYVDATWGEANITEADAKAGDVVNYAYLGITSEELLKTHKPESEVSLPVCAAIADNYYVREGRYLEQFNKKMIDSMIESARNANVISLKGANLTIYEELYMYLIEEANACKIMKCSGISYIEDELNYILTIYFDN